jgi:hypothetical protein
MLIAKLPVMNASNCSIGRGPLSMSVIRPIRMGSKFTAMASTNTLVHMDDKVTRHRLCGRHHRGRVARFTDRSEPGAQIGRRAPTEGVFLRIFLR